MEKKKQSSVSVMIMITVATFMGKILGLGRDVLISYYYGSTEMTDAFFLAMSIPTIILGVLTSSTDSAVIPQYKRICLKQSRAKADDLFSTIINSLLVVCGIVSILLFCFPDFFVTIFAPKFDKDAVAYCAKFLRFFAPLGLLHMLYCFFCTYGAAHEENRVRTVLSFLTNLLVVLCLLFVHDKGMIALSLSYLLANFISGLLPVIQARRLGYKHAWRISCKNVEFKEFWLLFVPIMGGALLNDVQQYVDKFLSSGISGGISSLNYASKLINIFDSIFIVGISVVLLPKLSAARVKEETEEYRRISSKVVDFLLLFLAPCFVLLFVLAEDFVVLLYGRGAFDVDSIQIVTKVLRTYSPLIVLVPMQTIFSRFFYAFEENKIPFRLNFISVIINCILSVILVRWGGLSGISLATTIATFIICMSYIIIIKKKIGWDSSIINIRKVSKLVLLVVGALVVTWIIWSRISWALGRILICSGIGIIFFVIGYAIFAREEITIVIGYVKNYIKKFNLMK